MVKNSDVVIQSEIVLDRVRLYAHEQVHADIAAMHRVGMPRIAEGFDGLEIRHTFDGWGKLSTITLRCPVTWWQHLKLALRQRWPRLFGRLVVRFHEVSQANGAIVAGLAPIRGRHRVIPVHMPPASRFYDDPTRGEE
jgi:hypothetical protein